MHRGWWVFGKCLVEDWEWVGVMWCGMDAKAEVVEGRLVVYRKDRPLREGETAGSNGHRQQHDVRGRKRGR